MQYIENETFLCNFQPLCMFVHFVQKWKKVLLLRRNLWILQSLFCWFFFAGAGIGLSSNGNMFGNFARWNEPNTSPPPPSTPSLSMSKKGGIDIGGSSEEKEKMPSGPSNKLHIQVLDSGEYTVSIRSTVFENHSKKSHSLFKIIIFEPFYEPLGPFSGHFRTI